MAVESIRAQKKFSYRYKLVRTNTLIMAAENDRFVHNRAMAMFLKQAPNAQMFFARIPFMIFSMKRKACVVHVSKP